MLEYAVGRVNSPTFGNIHLWRVSVGLLKGPPLWFDDATLNFIFAWPRTAAETEVSTISLVAKVPLLIVIGRYLGTAYGVKSVFSMNTKYLVFGFTLFAVTWTFLDLTLYKTSIPTTLVPKSITSWLDDNSRPNVLSVPVSSNVCLIVFWISVVVVVVVTHALVSLTLLTSTSLPVTRLSITSSSIKVALSLPFQVVSEEFQKLDAIPPFSRSSTPNNSDIASNALSISIVCGVKGISSIQKSELGTNSIEPIKTSTRNGFKFSTLVALGWSMNTDSVYFKVKAAPPLVILPSVKSVAKL